MNETENETEVQSGQVWGWEPFVGASPRDKVPTEIRVVAPYPFAGAGEKIWIVETVGVVENIWKIPEVSLRNYYSLREEAS